MEYYSAIWRNEVLTYIIMWMNPEDIVLSKRSQSQRNTYLYDFIEMKCPAETNPESENRVVLPGAREDAGTGR